MKLYWRYIAFLYFKNVAVIFFGLVIFYTSVDLMVNLNSLPESANLKLIYISLNALTSINYALPLSIIFGMIVTKFSMIRSNELISMYACGVSKTKLLQPLLVATFSPQKCLSPRCSLIFLILSRSSLNLVSHPFETS